MLGLSSNLRYFLCCTPIDIRNGFDGLAGIVRNHLKNDPVSGAVFIFLNKNRTHIKLLYWDGDGFALFYKRLERGRYALTAHNSPEKEIKREEVLMLLEGLSFDRMKRKSRYKIS
jgi:transposase